MEDPNRINNYIHENARWAANLPRISPGSKADLYLRSRGLGFKAYPPDLRMDRDQNMIALIRDYYGGVASYHRTFLKYENGEWQKKRMIMKNPDGYTIPEGSAIRIGRAGPTLGVAEGIESALAAYKATRQVTWSTVTAPLMGKWIPPKGIENVIIFKDSGRAGDLAAEKLEERCRFFGGKNVKIVEPAMKISPGIEVVMSDIADCLSLHRSLIGGSVGDRERICGEAGLKLGKKEINLLAEKCIERTIGR